MRVVAHDGSDTETHVLQLFGIAADAVDDGLDVRAVIADEHQHQPVRAAQSLQRFVRAKGIGEFEIVGFPAKIGNWGANGHTERFL